MESCNDTTATETKGIIFDLGTFEGFSFRAQSAIPRNLTAAEIVNWDHDRQGEAEFWPAGDHAGMRVLFDGRNTITAADLLALDRILGELGDDSTENFLRIHYAVNYCGYDMETLTEDRLADMFVEVFQGSNFTDLRQETAYQLFELYFPEEYKVWEKSLCDGLMFDTDRFLDSPSWCVVEVDFGETKALIVAPQ